MNELRDFVTDGGTLITFNNARMFAINQFKLPVTNALAGLNANQFFCSGCLRHVNIEDQKNPLTAGLLPETVVMFERGPAFDTEQRIQGQSAGAISCAAIAAGQRLSGGCGSNRGQGCCDRSGLGKRASDPDRVQAAVARPIARDLQVFLQRTVWRVTERALFRSRLKLARFRNSEFGFTPTFRRSRRCRSTALR